MLTRNTQIEIAQIQRLLGAASGITSILPSVGMGQSVTLEMLVIVYELTGWWLLVHPSRCIRIQVHSVILSSPTFLFEGFFKRLKKTLQWLISEKRNNKEEPGCDTAGRYNDLCNGGLEGNKSKSLRKGRGTCTYCGAAVGLAG